MATEIRIPGAGDEVLVAVAGSPPTRYLAADGVISVPDDAPATSGRTPAETVLAIFEGASVVHASDPAQVPGTEGDDGGAGVPSTNPAPDTTVPKPRKR